MRDERRARFAAEPVHDVQHAGRARPPRARARAKNDADAGVCSDGFTTAALPQKIAGNAFHATFGSGVLKLMIERSDAEWLPQRQHRAVRHARRRRPAVRAAALARR